MKYLFLYFESLILYKMMRRGYTILFLFMVAFASHAIAQPIDAWQRKADALYQNKEWGELIDEYEKMLLKYPRQSTLYVRPIIAATKLRTPQLVMRYVEMSEKNGVSLDSLFTTLEYDSRQLGDASIYERTLLLVKEQQPWLSRLINAKLFTTYSSRHEWDKALKMVNTMLSFSPQDQDLLKMKAKVFASWGREDSAAVIYEKIALNDPRDRDINIYLGNYYYMHGYAKLNKSKKEYETLVNPTRMQYLSYQKAQKEVINTYYSKAAHYLEIEEKVRTTPYLRKILYEIYVQQSDTQKAEAMKSRLSQ